MHDGARRRSTTSYREDPLDAAADLLARATDEMPEADDTAQRILDAARDVFATFGLRRTTMEDVAKRAGMGRATVYRKFENKEELVQRVFLAELQAYLQELDQITERHGDFAEQMVEGYVATLRYVREESLLHTLVALDGEWGLAYVTQMAGPVLAVAREYLAGKMRLAQAAGVVGSFDPEPVAELLVRVCHSQMLVPEGVIPYDDEDAARMFAREVLVPIVTNHRS